MRVIFVDIDGVLNHPKVWGAWSKLGYDAALDPSCVARLAATVAALGAKCVLSSTWRLGRVGLSHTVECLTRRGWSTAKDDFIDKTPHLPGCVRGIEIGEWLVAHPEVVEYAIVDDDDDMSTHRHRLVLTDAMVGLTDANCDQVKALFESGGG